MYHQCARKLRSSLWSKFAAPHSLQRSLSVVNARTLQAGSRQLDSSCTRLRQRQHRLLPGKLLHTESQDDKQQQQQRPKEAEQSLPVPQMANVLQHLRQLASTFASSPPENAQFCSMLDQLASMEVFTDRLDELLKQKMDSRPEYLLEQSLLRQQRRQLQHRDSLAVYSNCALLYPNLRPQTLSLGFIIEYVSAMILSLLSYRSKLRQESPQLYRQMFASCRVPGATIDTHHLTAEKSPGELSLIISRQSNFFIVELNEQMAEGEMFFVLKKVIEFILNYKNTGTIAFGALSALPRTDATFGAQFLNESALKRLQEASFLINLDHVDQEGQDRNELLKQILAGNQYSVGNRWFDKALQLILVLSAEANQIAASGICFEKSQVTADSVVELMQHGIGFITKFKPVEMQPEAASTEDNKLMIKLQKLDLVQPGKREVLTSATNEFALKKYSRLIDSFHLTRFNFAEYGHAFIESVNCDPEAWVQVAIRFAHRNYCYLGKSAVAASARLRPYKGITQELLDFFEDPQSEDKLRIALESWQFYQQLNESGYDIDNITRVYEHLIGEDEASQLPGNAIDIYKSLLRHPVLQQVSYSLVYATRSIPMSSTVYSGLIEANGPLVPGGFACSYQFHKNGSIEFTITHQRDEKPPGNELVLGEFAEFVRHALVQMKSTIAC